MWGKLSARLGEDLVEEVIDWLWRMRGSCFGVLELLPTCRRRDVFVWAT